MLKIKFINAEETYPIRLEVLRKNIDLPYKFSGDDLETTFHLGGFIDDELIGVSTFMKNSINDFKTYNQYQLRGMATLDKARGKGVGKELLLEAQKVLQKKEIEVLWCNAREVALEFYKKQGFKTIGDFFMIDKVGLHYRMYITVKK